MKNETIIQKLAEIRAMLEAHASGVIPDIEKDLILKNLQEIYSAIKFSASTQENFSIGNDASDSTIIAEHNQEELLEIESDKLEEPVQIQQPDNSKSTKETPKKEVIKEETTQPQGQKTLADLYGTRTPLMNEVLAEKMKRKDLSTVLQSKPIDSLEHAIDINAKFLFVRELFFNNVQLFEKTVRIIDSAATFNDAFNYLQQQFLWNYESEVVQRFLELVRRRFIKDEA
ncbi:MAG: hypothetical protein WHT29_04985 [Bacteroidales bacterium]